MYQSISRRTVRWLIRKGTIRQEEQAVYEYSFEVLYSDLMYALFGLAIAVLLHGVLATALFLAGFLPIRKFGGGYHASTYLRCHLLFAGNQIAAILLFHLVPQRIIAPVVVVLVVVSTICVLAFAPVEHENRPFSDSERKHFRRMSVSVLAVSWGILLLLICFRLMSSEYALAYFFGVFSVSISLLFERIKKRKEGRHHDEKDC